MKKVEAGILFSLIILTGVILVTAQDQNDESSKIDKAYSCAVEKAKGKCKDLTLDEQVFSLLGLSFNGEVRDDCKKALVENSEDSKCWPKGSCKVKDTALALLALKHIGSDTSQAVNWLISKNGTPKDLTWFLQIDANEETNCKISYGGKDFTTTIKADKTLTQGAGSCLSRAQSNYWLQISPSCLHQTYSVSCDKGFISSLIYKKTNSQVFYISSTTESAPASGNTENKVVSICFGNPCDYEGSLWATLALAKSGKDISAYLPYLNAIATDHEKFLPSAFLYILTSDEEHFSTLSSLHTGSFWDVKSSYGKFYDTALALLSLQNTNSEQSDASKLWLLDTQPSNGCWQNNLRDTAFTLYAAWPKASSQVSISPETYCKDANYYCITTGECEEAGGETLSNYFCPSLSVICCTKAAVKKTCQEKDGKICTDDEECAGNFLEASDSKSCCAGDCVKKQTQPECEIQEYRCKSSCDENEETASYSCTGDNICCKDKETLPEPEGRSYWWVWILVILIILVILGIIFRNRLRAIFNRKETGSESAGPRISPPTFPPRFPSRAPMRNPRFHSQLRPSEATDKELDETLRKLKEMGK